ADARALSLASERARRSAREARPTRRGTRRVRTRRGAGAQREGARATARPSATLCCGLELAVKTTRVVIDHHETRRRALARRRVRLEVLAVHHHAAAGQYPAGRGRAARRAV